MVCILLRSNSLTLQYRELCQILQLLYRSQKTFLTKVSTSMMRKKVFSKCQSLRLLVVRYLKFHLLVHWQQKNLTIPQEGCFVNISNALIWRTLLWWPARHLSPDGYVPFVKHLAISSKSTVYWLKFLNNMTIVTKYKLWFSIKMESTRFWIKIKTP